MDKINPQYPVLPINPVSKNKEMQKAKAEPGFKEILDQQVNRRDIKFSGHSIKRMEQNNINLSSVQVEKLTNAVNKAAQKGSKDSCIVMDNIAFVVSIDNRTVVTVVEGERMKDNSFTNIDSAVVL